jgi:hypothetical protein
MNMHPNLYSDKYIYNFIPIGYFTYYLTDLNIYSVSPFVHYSSLFAGIYFVKEKFIPGALFLGFHLAHEVYKYFH